MVILASGGLVSSLLGSGLVDELRIIVCPVVLGSGKMYFRDISEQVGLELADVKKYAKGSARLTYRVSNRATGSQGVIRVMIAFSVRPISGGPTPRPPYSSPSAEVCRRSQAGCCPSSRSHSPDARAWLRPECHRPGGPLRSVPTRDRRLHSPGSQ